MITKKHHLLFSRAHCMFTIRLFRILMPVIMLGTILMMSPTVYAQRTVVVLFTGFSFSGLSTDSGMYDLKDYLDSYFLAHPFTSKVFDHTQQAQARDWIRSFSDLSKMVLIGHSYGGDSVIELAKDYLAPQMVDLTIQIDSVGYGDDVLPSNVKKGINYYQRKTEFWESAILDPAGGIKTNVIGADDFNVEDLFGVDDSIITHTSIDNKDASIDGRNLRLYEQISIKIAVLLGLDDPDGDGLTNQQESQHGTDPNEWDTDGGDISDGVEVAAGTNPLDPGDDYTIDSDSDGLPDAWELQYWDEEDITKNNLIGDEDEDGLTNIQEYQEGTNPRKGDTDDGRVYDGDEVAAGMDPLDSSDDHILTNASLKYTGDTAVDYHPSYLPVSAQHQVDLKAELTDGAGNPLPSQKVEFVIGTDQIGDEVVGIIDKFTEITNYVGIARSSYDAVPSAPPGVYRIQARFKGNQTYEPSGSLPTEFVVTMNIYDYEFPSLPSELLHVGPGYPTGQYPTGTLYGDPPMGQGTINHIPIHSFSTDFIKLESGAQVVYSFDSPIASEAGNTAYVYLLINATMAFPEMYGNKVGTVKLSFDDGSEKPPVDLIIGNNVRHWWSGNNYMRFVNQIQSNSTKPAWWSPRWAESDIPPQYGQEYYYLDMMQIDVPPGKNLREITITSKNLVARGKYDVGLRIMGIQVVNRNWRVPATLQPGHLEITGIYSPFVYLKKAYLAQAATAMFFTSFVHFAEYEYSLWRAVMDSLTPSPMPGPNLSLLLAPLELEPVLLMYQDLFQGVRLLNLANDPPDYEYTVVVTPPMYVLPQLQPESPEEQALVDLLNSKTQVELQLAGYLEAIYVSLNRYSTAMADGDQNSAELQLAAIGSYSKSVNLMMQQSTDLAQPIIREWKKAGLPNPSVTESDVMELQERLSTSGFSEDEKQLFEQLGLTSDELDEIKDALVSASPKEVEGDFLTSLAKSADASKSLSDTFSSIAEDVGSQTTLTIPTIVSNLPAASANRIPLDGDITVEFTEPMDASTINTATVILKDEQSNIVPCEVTYIPETHTAVCHPLENLKPLEEYTVVLNTGIRNLAGMSLPWEWTWTFTTSGDKAYGGGWISHHQFKASFKLNVASVEDVIESGGSFKYFDQQTRTMINASSIDSLEIAGNQATIVGSCTVNGMSGYSFIAMIMNSAPDKFSLNVIDSEGNPVHSKSGDLAGGNLAVESVLLSPTP